MTKEKMVEKIKRMRDSGKSLKLIVGYIKKAEYNPKDFMYLLI